MATNDDRGGLPGISLRDTTLSSDRDHRPWSRRLMVFIRVMAAFELLKGLVYWGALIGAGGSPDPLGGVSPAWLANCVFFSVADPVAAVGLWLGAGWGVALWLLTTIGQIAFASVAPGVGRWVVISVTVAAMGVYVVLSTRARRETL